MKSGPARRVTPRPAGRGRRPSPLSIPEKRSGPPPVRRPGKPDPRIEQSALPKSVKGLDDVRPGGSRPRCPECFGNRGLLRCGTKGSNPFPSSEESCELPVQRRSDLADIGRKAWMMLSFCIVPSSSLLGTGNRPSVMRRLPAAQPFPTGTFSVDGTGGPEGQKVEGNSWRTST